MSWVHLNKQASKESSEKVYVPFAEHAGKYLNLAWFLPFKNLILRDLCATCCNDTHIGHRSGYIAQRPPLCISFFFFSLLSHSLSQTPTHLLLKV